MAYTKKGLGPALQRNYDKLIFAAAAVFLLASVIVYSKSGDTIRKETEGFRSEIDSMRPEHPDLAPTDTAAFVKADKTFGTPFAMVTNKLFLVAQERVRCVECNRPILFEATKCPHCGKDQSEEGKRAGGDSDGDGIPDEIEEQYAFLNPVDPTDASADQDSDGFSNLEEYLAGTDMADPKSHPSRVVFLRVRGIEEARIAYSLKGSVAMAAGGRKYQIKNMKTNQDFMVPIGSEINDPNSPDGTKYKVVSVETITEKRKKQGYSELRDVEVSVVTISNGSIQYRLKEGEPVGSSGEYRVSFLCTRDTNGQEYIGLANQAFMFDGEEFEVLKVDRARGSALIRRVSDKKEFSVPRQ
jgi:hypothetical protein